MHHFLMYGYDFGQLSCVSVESIIIKYIKYLYRVHKAI